MDGGNQILIFVSHATVDKDLATAVGDLLKEAVGRDKIRLTCSSDDQYLPGQSFPQEIVSEVTSCPVHIAVVTEASLDSEYVLLELGARWGADKDTFVALVPNFSSGQLPSSIPQEHLYELSDPNSLDRLVEDSLKNLDGTFDSWPPTQKYEELHKRVVEEAKRYTRKHPEIMRFDWTDNPRRLSADQITEAAERFLDDKKMPSVDLFAPDIVVGVNSGGTFAASIFCERKKTIKMGTIWTKRDGRSNRLIDAIKTWLPESSKAEPRRVLLVDSKLGTGDSVRIVVDFVRKKWPHADIRILAALVYGGWKDNDKLTFKEKNQWPVYLESAGISFYALYYTTRSKDQDDIEEPGKPPRTVSY
jgi:hypoxanthine phosphoribosyltransferase